MVFLVKSIFPQDFTGYSGSMTQTWRLGASSTVNSQSLAYEGSATSSKSYPTTAVISGFSATGSMNLVFSYVAQNGDTGNMPFYVYNPNRIDDNRLGQSASIYKVTEISSASAAAGVPVGYNNIVQVAIFVSGDRVAMNRQPNIIMEQFLFTKKQSASTVYVNGVLASYSPYSGSMRTSWRLGNAPEVLCPVYHYVAYSGSHVFETTAYINNQPTVGPQLLQFKYIASGAGSAESPFNIYNPNNYDDTRLDQTQSVYVVWEYASSSQGPTFDSNVVQVYTYTDNARSVLSYVNSIQICSFSFTKQLSNSTLLVEGTISGFGQYSGALMSGWRYGSTPEVNAQPNMFQNYGGTSVILPTKAVIRNAPAGTANLVFRFFAYDGQSGQAPFTVLNPNSADDARLGQTQSVYRVWELVGV
jgi:hypothetical protein